MKPTEYQMTKLRNKKEAYDSVMAIRVPLAKTQTLDQCKPREPLPSTEKYDLRDPPTDTATDQQQKWMRHMQSWSNYYTCEKAFEYPNPDNTIDEANQKARLIIGEYYHQLIQIIKWEGLQTYNDLPDDLKPSN